jgi:hypothetical protein
MFDNWRKLVAMEEVGELEGWNRYFQGSITAEE